MAALDISAVNALTAKATALSNKGRDARAGELYAAAISAAQALAQPDCLIVAYLQVLHASTLISAAHASGDSAAALRVSRRAAFLDILPAPLAALQRRNAAGTLRSGACRSHEEAWFYAKLQAQGEARGKTYTHEFLARRAVAVGYDAFLLTASLVLNMFGVNADVEFAMPAAWLETACAFVLEGIRLLAQAWAPRESNADAPFVSNLQFISEQEFDQSDTWRVRIVSEWRRVEASGALRHGVGQVDSRARAFESTVAQQRVRAAASAAARGLHACALPGCGAHETHALHFQLCTACKTARYCCKEHHAADWPRHKRDCKAARKAADAARDDAGGAGTSA
jgi:hypothetical protein